MNEDKRAGRARFALAAVAAGLALAAVPAAASAASSVSIDGSRLAVIGTAGWDQFTVTDVNDPGCPGGPPCYEVETYGDAVAATAPCVVTDPGPYSGAVQCPAAGVESIRAIGREGRDTMLVSDFVFGLTVPAVLDGGGDEDALTGSDGADRLIGGDGDDDLNGRRANDVLLGGVGKDRLDGARGSDRLVGGFGPDRLIGGTGADRLFGLAGRDILDGQQGRDLCNGGKQTDRARNCESRRRIP
jgi:Ca2+-binding RTX toxin-like protein